MEKRRKGGKGLHWFISVIVLFFLVTMAVSPAFAITRPPASDGTGSGPSSAPVVPAAEPKDAPAASQIQAGALLADRFGVVPQLQEPHDGGTYYSFDWNSLEPTKNLNTVDWVESDWYGNWSTDAFGGTTIRGEFPAGAEWYDVEGLYFDNDATNLYVAIITSVPQYSTWDLPAGGTESGVGVLELRDGYHVWLRPGDLSINLGLNTPRVERNGTTWSYDYGVDIVHEDRNTLGGTAEMRDNAVGDLLYRTINDAGGSDVENPPSSDWYTSAPGYEVTAYWEHTNFDPLSTQSLALHGAPYDAVGSVMVDYSEYTFPAGATWPEGTLENNAATYIVEVTIPRALLGDDNPGDGDSVGIRWVEGCRNDGEEDVAVIHLTGDIDDTDTGDAPDSSNHAGVGMTYGILGDSTVGNFPTVSDIVAGGGAPYGMCHLLIPTGAYLGDGVSAEADADLLPDQDVSSGAEAFTNIEPVLDISDADTDDGLILPDVWQDGVGTEFQYIVTVPAGNTNTPHYVNVWFDWNRDGDWADSGVACRTAHNENEHVLVNELVDLTPGTSQTFSAPINPCNPDADGQPLWVRITLSDEEVMNTDGSGPGYCFAEGETEDWLMMPRPPTAVGLASFEATGGTQSIVVNWATASELDNMGFNLARAETADGPWTQLNDSLLPSLVPPGSPAGAEYSFEDTAVQAGVTYYYRLEDQDVNGQSEFHGPVNASLQVIRRSLVRPRPRIMPVR